MNHQPGRILLADDEMAILVTMEALLRRRGYDITTASNGLDAIRLIEQTEFDLLLLDLMMPGMTGIEVAKHARAIQPSVAILILTGSSPIEGSIEDLDFAGFDYMTKTASPQEVLDRVVESLVSR
jgi:DNA-binding response OmpR family regulator